MKSEGNKQERIGLLGGQRGPSTGGDIKLQLTG